MVESPELIDFSVSLGSLFMQGPAFSLLAIYSQLEKLKIGSAKIKCFWRFSIAKI
jgi:hypothetical protein